MPVARNKNEWFKLRYRDWLEDERVLRLSPAAQGILFRCICLQGIYFSIPSDKNELSRRLQIDREVIEAEIDSVGALFQSESKDGEVRLYEPSVREVLSESLRARRAQAKGAATTNAKRIGNRDGNRTAKRSGKRAVRASISSSSSISSSLSSNTGDLLSGEETGSSPNGFAEFYAAYPRKVGRANAEKAWGKLSPSSELCRTIAADIAARSKTWDWQKDGGQFVPHPATYLNQQRWTDELPKGNGAVAMRAPQQSALPLNAPSTIDPSLDFPDDLPAGLEFCHESAKLWAAAMGKLAEQDQDEYDAWLKGLSFLGVFGSGRRMAIACPDKTVCNWVSSMWRDAIEEAAGAPGLAFRLSFIVRPTE